MRLGQRQRLPIPSSPRARGLVLVLIPASRPPTANQNDAPAAHVESPGIFRSHCHEEEAMAEIQVEPKRGLGWVWVIVALVIIALILWYLLSPGTTSPADTAIGTSTLLGVRRASHA
jgi:hypothetical protein